VQRFAANAGQQVWDRITSDALYGRNSSAWRKAFEYRDGVVHGGGTLYVQAIYWEAAGVQEEVKTLVRPIPEAGPLHCFWF
jgi:hypothetical protein